MSWLSSGTILVHLLVYPVQDTTSSAAPSAEVSEPQKIRAKSPSPLRAPAPPSVQPPVWPPVESAPKTEAESILQIRNYLQFSRNYAKPSAIIFDDESDHQERERNRIYPERLAAQEEAFQELVRNGSIREAHLFYEFPEIPHPEIVRSPEMMEALLQLADSVGFGETLKGSPSIQLQTARIKLIRTIEAAFEKGIRPPAGWEKKLSHHALPSRKAKSVFLEASDSLRLRWLLKYGDPKSPVIMDAVIDALDWALEVPLSDRPTEQQRLIHDQAVSNWNRMSKEERLAASARFHSAKRDRPPQYEERVAILKMSQEFLAKSNLQALDPLTQKRLKMTFRAWQNNDGATGHAAIPRPKRSRGSIQGICAYLSGGIVGGF